MCIVRVLTEFVGFDWGDYHGILDVVFPEGGAFENFLVRLGCLLSRQDLIEFNWLDGGISDEATVAVILLDVLDLETASLLRCLLYLLVEAKLDAVRALHVLITTLIVHHLFKSLLYRV